MITVKNNGRAPALDLVVWWFLEEVQTLGPGNWERRGKPMRGSQTRSPRLREEDGVEGGAGGCAGKKLPRCAGKSVGTEETRPAT